MNPSKENAMLIDIQYVRAKKKLGIPDYLYIVWKDLDTGIKHLQQVPEPKMDIYFEKRELRNHNYNKTYEYIKNLDKMTVKYKDILYAIAEDAGPNGKRFLSNIFETGRFDKMREIYLYPFTFGSDYDVVSWYRIQWLRKLNNDRIKTLYKGFMDIEVDGYDTPGMPSPKDCPVNAITYIDEKTHGVYTFLLTDRVYEPKRYSNDKEIQAQEEQKRRDMYESMHSQQCYVQANLEELDKELHEMFDENYPELKYYQYFYSDERKMLVHFFQLLHNLKPDFCAIWNISFDMPYLIERAKVLGMDPTEMICHPDFPNKEIKFRADIYHHDIKNKNDVMYASGYTVFIDQMETYANIRKGQNELRGFKLNNIADVELKDKKLSYNDVADIKTLPYVDYKKFIIYNIKDVILQYGIERKVSDFDTLYVTSYENATAYQQTSMQTVKLRNVQYLSYLSQGLIPGNNINIFNEGNAEPEDEDEDDDVDDDEDDEDGKKKFEGAIVADPIYNDYVGVELYGKKTNNVFNAGVDFDMSAFYPNTIMAMNIDPSCLIFKAYMNSEQFDFKENGELKFHGITKDQMQKPDADAGKEFFDNLQTRNYMSTGHKWLNTPSVYDVYKEIQKRRKKGLL